MHDLHRGKAFRAGARSLNGRLGSISHPAPQGPHMGPQCRQFAPHGLKQRHSRAGPLRRLCTRQARAGFTAGRGFASSHMPENEVKETTPGRLESQQVSVIAGRCIDLTAECCESGNVGSVGPNACLRGCIDQCERESIVSVKRVFIHRGQTLQCLGISPLFHVVRGQPNPMTVVSSSVYGG